MIYQLGISEHIPGKFAEWNEIVTKELHPLWPKLGVKLAGSFHAYTGNMNETYTLTVCEDMATLQKIRDAQRKDKDYQRVNALLAALRTRQFNVLLEPNPWSPMK